MGNHASLHPTEQTLSDFSLGKLDDGRSEIINNHLNECPDCQRLVAEMSSDSFLGRLQGARGRLDPVPVAGSSLAGLSQIAGEPASAEPPPSSSLPPGLADHPDYQVLRELGQGGMGTVYLAQNRLMGRNEVLKVVSGHLIKRRGVLDRFQVEIRNAGRLHHTNIVTAYSASRLGESIVFAMEYVEGLDLSKLVKAKGPLPVANACNYVHQASLGLQHAHEQGMVHRDIKPSNLMLAREGNRAIIKVLDFGLAKIKSEGPIDGALTQEGQMLGTPDYIAPEQIRDARGSDIRADIYSTGCTLYYLLTGRPPFPATSLYELLQAHHSMDATPLNFARPAVPVELAALVAKMMAKEPERRFQEPKEVAQALTPFFKKGGMASGISKAEVSQVGQPHPKQGIAEVASQSTKPATSLAPAAASPVKKSRGTTLPESAWESLIELKETEPVKEPAPVVAAAGSPRPPWMWPAVAVGMFFLGVVLAGALIMRVKTKNGEIVVQNVPEKAEASVNGEKVKLKLPGDPDPVEITEGPGGRGVSVKKGGTEVTGKEVKIRIGDGEGISAGFEPHVATSPRKDGAEAGDGAGEVDNGGFVRLFNGKDLTGWKNQLPHNGSEWTVDDGVLECRGGGEAGRPAVLRSNRQDFANFRLRIRTRYPHAGGGYVEVRISLPNELRSSYGVYHGAWPTTQVYQGVPGCISKIKDVKFGTRGNFTAVKVDPFPVSANEWHDLVIEAVRNRITVSLDGKKISEYTDFDEPYSSGAIALGCPFDSVVQFQEVMIKELPAAGASSQPPAAQGPSIPPFNGKDLTGWDGFHDNHAADPADCVRIEGEELVWDASTYGQIYLNKVYSNFSFKFEYSIPVNGLRRQASCRFRLVEASTFRFGQVDCRINSVACLLLNNDPSHRGDLELFEPEYPWRVPPKYVAQRTMDTEVAAGNWNEAEVRCEDRSIIFFLNGSEVNRVQADKGVVCHPGLHSWSTDIRIRNIRILPLANANPAAKNETPF
jgi:serine/threonine protein kinase